MPLTALTDTQKIFLDNYIRKHPLKGIRKKERAVTFSDLRQNVVDLLPNVPATGDGARFASRLQAIDAKADAGEFKVARDAMAKLLGDLRNKGASYSADGDLETLKTMVVGFVTDAQEATTHYDAYRNSLRQILPKLQAIPVNALPTGVRGSPGWIAIATPLIQAREPDIAAVEQGLALCRDEVREVGRFLNMAYENFVSGLNKQNALATEILKGDASPSTRDLVEAQLRRVRVPAFAPLCEAGQPGKFLDADVFREREDRNLRAIAAQLRALKDQVASLTAEGGFGDVVADEPVGVNVQQQVKLREQQRNPRLAGMVGRRQAPIDRMAQQRALVARTRERQRLIALRNENFDALTAEQLADEQALAALGPQPTDLSQKVAPPKAYNVASLAASLPAPTGDVLPSGNPDTDYAPDDRELARLADASSTALLQHIATEGITDFAGDEFFDLSLQSAKEFAEAYCAAKGWTGPRLTKGRAKVAQAVGQAVYARVLKFNAEKVTNDGRPIGSAIDPKKGQVLIDGKSYGQPKELARGGFGVVSRYESVDTPGSYVVVKSTIRGEALPADAEAGDIEAYVEEVNDGRQAMKREVKAHKHLMRAAAATGAEGAANIVGMKGAMAAEDGSLHMVLEIVDGGDLDDNRFAMMIAASSGALPEEARNILNQARIKQAVQGMKFMRDQDLVHFDIKGANFMVAGDGTIKVGDFGSAGVSASGDGQVTASRDNPGTQGFVPGQAADGDVVDSAYDTFALGKLMQIAHLNVTNPLQAGFKTDLPPEFEQINGALARVTKAMTNADADERPQLEQVLESSYLKNLDSFDPGKIDELSRTAVDYAKALKKEAATVRAQVPQADLKLWAGGKDPDSLGFADLSGPMQVVIGKAQAKALDLRNQLEALGPAPVVPANVIAGRARAQAASDAQHLAAKTKIETSMATELKTVKDKQALLALFGQSDEAKQLAQRMRDISNQLLRPSGADPSDQAPQLGERQIKQRLDHFKLRLTSMSPAMSRAKLNPQLVQDDLKRLVSEAGTFARRNEFDRANALLDELQEMIGS